MKAAIFSCKGLGDGLISIALANNLSLNKYEIDVFHDTLGEMQTFFKNFNIKKYPNFEDINFILSTYDQIFILYDESNNFMMNLINKGKTECENKIFVLNPCPSKKIGSQPYYSDALFNPRNCIIENIDIFCKKILNLKKTSKRINYIFPCEFEHKKYKNRVIIHPSSAKISKNLPEKKYIKLAKILKNKNYEPIFVVSKKEKREFIKIRENEFILKFFDNLKDLTLFVYESSYMIGNDSGIGHLSSMLGISTVSIFRNYRSARLWRPGWGKNVVIYPNKFIPNFSLYRLRDKHWKNFISTKKILKEFFKLI